MRFLKKGSLDLTTGQLITIISVLATLMIILFWILTDGKDGLSLDLIRTRLPWG